VKVKGICGRVRPCKKVCSRVCVCPLGLRRRQTQLQAARSRRLEQKLLNTQRRLF